MAAQVNAAAAAAGPSRRRVKTLTLDLREPRGSRVAVRVVVATSAGTVGAARTHRLCRPGTRRPG